MVGVVKRDGRRAYAHYEVVVGIHRSTQRILTLDPAHGLRTNTRAGFAAEWGAARRLALIVLPRQVERIAEKRGPLLGACLQPEYGAGLDGEGETGMHAGGDAR